MVARGIAHASDWVRKWRTPLDEHKTVHTQQTKMQSGEGEPHGSGPDPLPPDSLDINVEGMELSGPERGFGQLWRKNFRVSLTGADVSPEDVIRTWRERFGEMWPEGNHFYRPLTGLKPGEVALADLEMPANSRLSTGIVVTRVAPTEFTFVTPEGHTLAGEITFSAHDESGTTIAEVEVLLRASDPLFELGMPLGGHKRENAFWQQTLTNLANHFGVESEPETSSVLLDSHRQWRKATNIVNNSYIRTAIYMATKPLRRVLGRLGARDEQS